MSRVLAVSSSGYYNWKKHKDDKLNVDRDLDERIREVFDASQGTYGSPRVTMILNAQQIQISKSTVARKMKALRITARPKKKYVVTTDSQHDYPIADNLLNREFEVNKPNLVWVSDITYIRVANYWMYLTVIIDLSDRMVYSPSIDPLVLPS